jgi:hypothetical protein
MTLHSPLMENAAFLADFDRLRDVSLNPTRHTSANAHEHSLGVATRAPSLAAANGCTDVQTSVLRDLGLVHQIGAGSAYGIVDIDRSKLAFFCLLDELF